jgi:antitoxin (DNA-binding transcriptional repressor) of toxin-antitoxin stability system
MIKANIHAAKTNLSKLIEHALAGEEVVIAKAGKALVKLTPVVEEPKIDRRHVFGSYKGHIWIAPDFDAPDPEIERLFYEGDPLPGGVAEE